MGDQEESGVDDHTSNRNQSAATARSRGWQSGGGLWSHRLHQHHRGHREAGAQAHRGKIHTMSLFLPLCDSQRASESVLYSITPDYGDADTAR
jgi:hypothetical protein